MPRIAAGGGARVTRPQPAGDRTSRGRAASDVTSFGLATSDVEGLAPRREATSRASRRRRAAAERVVTCAEAPCRRADSWNTRARSIVCTLSVSRYVACALYNVSAAKETLEPKQEPAYRHTSVHLSNFSDLTECCGQPKTPSTLCTMRKDHA